MSSIFIIIEVRGPIFKHVFHILCCDIYYQASLIEGLVSIRGTSLLTTASSIPVPYFKVLLFYFGSVHHLKLIENSIMYKYFVMQCSGSHESPSSKLENVCRVTRVRLHAFQHLFQLITGSIS